MRIPPLTDAWQTALQLKTSLSSRIGLAWLHAQLVISQTRTSASACASATPPMACTPTMSATNAWCNAHTLIEASIPITPASWTALLCTFTTKRVTCAPAARCNAWHASVPPCAWAAWPDATYSTDSARAHVSPREIQSLMPIRAPTCAWLHALQRISGITQHTRALKPVQLNSTAPQQPDFVKTAQARVPNAWTFPTAHPVKAMPPWPSTICAIAIAARPSNITTMPYATHHVLLAPTSPTTVSPAWRARYCARLAMVRPPTAPAAVTVTTTITAASPNALPDTTAH